MEPDDLPAPQPEAVRNEPKITMPVVPILALPETEVGVHHVGELRLHGAALRGSEIRLKGYVTSIARKLSIQRLAPDGDCKRYESCPRDTEGVSDTMK